MWQARAELLGESLAATESKLLALTPPQSLVEAPGAPQAIKPTMGPLYGRLRVLAPWLLGLLLIVAVAGLTILGHNAGTP